MGQNLGPLNIRDTYQDLVQISGSLLTDGTGSVITSVDVSSSYATNAGTASTAGNAGSAATATSASHALVADNGGVTSIIAGTNISVDTSTGDVTISAADAAAINTGSFFVDASVSDATLTFTQGDGSTIDRTVDNVSNATFATNAGSATTATSAVSATSASYVQGANVEGAVASATTASHALQADNATAADTATTASHALVADSVLGSIENAVTASYILGSGVDGAVDLATNVDVTTQTSGQYRVAFTDQTGTTSGISNSTSLTWDESTDTLAGAQAINATTFTGDLVGDVTGNADTATSASHAAQADNATAADTATTASLALQADNATNADSATTATSADTATTASHALFAIAGDGVFSGSFSGSYIGDGSQLTGVSTDPFPFTGSVNIKPDGGTFTGTPGTDTVIMNVDNVSGNISANDNIRTFAGGLYSLYSGSSAEDIEIDNNQDTFIWGGERSQYSSFTVNNMTGSAVIACGRPGLSVYAGSDGSYTSPPRNSAMIASSGQFRGGMINCAAIGTDNVNMNGAGNYGYGMVVLGGQNARLNRNFRSVIIGGNNNQFPNSFQDGLLIAGGESNNVYGNNNTAVGGQSGNMNGGSNNAMFGGRGYTVGSGADTCMLLGGWGNNLDSGHTDSIVGGRANTINNRNTNAEAGNGILFGRRNTLESNNMDQNFIVAGAYNNVSGSIQGGGIIGGSGSLAYHNRSVIIGGHEMETAHDDTVYVPNLVASGSVRGEVGALTISSNTASMDCSEGNFFTLSMPAGGDVHLNPTNIRAGQTINVKTTQNASAATISFPSSVEFEGGTAFTVSTGSGAVDVMTFISFDGSSLQATGLKNFS